MTTSVSGTGKQRDPKWAIIRKGTVLWRCHRSALGAIWFNCNGTQRFDDPDQKFGVLYVSKSANGAMAETILHGNLSTDPILSAIRLDKFTERSLTKVKTIKSMRFVALHDGGHQIFGKDAGLMSASGKEAYAKTGKLSRYVHNKWPEADGIMYRARHLDSEISLAVFKRAEPKMDVAGMVTNPIIDADRDEFLAAIKRDPADLAAPIIEWDV